VTAADRPRLRRDVLQGWEALVLENGVLQVVVLPNKGADVVRLVDVESGLNLLFEAPGGLLPPGAPPRDGSGDLEFLWNYEGGWQELFPNAGDPTFYAGQPVPFHGEVATLPWSWEVEREDDEELAVRFVVDCRIAPLRLERVMRLARGSATLVLDEVATNLSRERPAQLVWGHHCVLGPPLVESGARLDVPAETIVTLPELWENTARLEPGQRSSWPHGRLRAGGTTDLRVVPGSEAASHDDVYLTDLAAGYAAVENPRLGLGFRLDFDPAVFRWVISWQPYGGAEAPPLGGSYALGIEPWISSNPLGEAVEAGEAVKLAVGAALSTRVCATVTRTKEER
jgi:hypothetical protein